MSKIIVAANQAFDAAAKIVVEGNNKIWAHPMLAESDAKRVATYREDVRLLARLAEDTQDEMDVLHILRQFEGFVRFANHNVQVAYNQAEAVQK